MPRFRPRLRFSLRTLFVLVTVLAILLGWFLHERRIVQERDAVRAWVVRAWHEGNPIGSMPLVFQEDKDAELPWIRRLLGDRLEVSIALFGASAADMERVRAAFPEARLYNARSE